MRSLLAFRAMLIRERSQLWSSYWVEVAWDGYYTEARCIGFGNGDVVPANHSTPVEACTCGIYGALDPARAMRYLPGIHSVGDHGALFLSEHGGRTIVGARGVRSQYASIIGLIHSYHYIDIRPEQADFLIHMPELQPEEFSWFSDLPWYTVPEAMRLVAERLEEHEHWRRGKGRQSSGSSPSASRVPQGEAEGEAD